MTKRPTESMQAPEVLTLTEAAEYLRVAESELSKLASERGVPGQRIGEEWRFHKPALIGWLAYVAEPYRQFQGSISWLPESSSFSQILALLEARIEAKQGESEAPKRGSKKAVMEYFGIFRDDDDLEDQLAKLRSYRDSTDSEDEE